MSHHMRQEIKSYGSCRNSTVRALGPLWVTLLAWHSLCGAFVLRLAFLMVAGRLQQFKASAPGPARSQRGRHSLFLCSFY